MTDGIAVSVDPNCLFRMIVNLMLDLFGFLRGVYLEKARRRSVYCVLYVLKFGKSVSLQKSLRSSLDYIICFFSDGKK